MALVYLLLIGLSIYGLRVVKALERSQPDSSDLDALADEIERLREQHQALSRQIESTGAMRDFDRRMASEDRDGR